MFPIITDFIPDSADESVSLEQLSVATGLSPREVKREVLQARIAGALILSSEHGYWMAENADQVRDYVTRRRAYLKTAMAALQPFIRAVK